MKMLEKWGLIKNENTIPDAPVESEINEEEISNLQAVILEFTTSNNLERNMISYTASVVQNDIIEGKWYWQMKCEECLHAFSEDEFIDDDLVDMKMKTTRLRQVAKSTFDICVTAEKLMQKFDYQPENYDKIPTELLRIINIDDLFSHSNFDTHSELNHKKRLINLIIKMYVH